MKQINFDMDGVMAKWTTDDIPRRKLFTQKFFKELLPDENVIGAIKYIVRNRPDVEVHVRSAVLHEGVIKAKESWLDKYLPEIKKENRHFNFVWQSKSECLDNTTNPADFILVDDYTKNLIEWKNKGGVGIKYLNGRNGTHGKWQGDRVNCECNSEDLARTLLELCEC